MTSMKMRARLPLGLFTALSVLLGLIANPGKSSAIEPNNCINPWSVNKPASDPTRDWHEILGLKKSEYVACHSCYDGVDPATGHGYTNIPWNKSALYSNVGVAFMTDVARQSFIDQLPNMLVTWVIDLDESIEECRNGINSLECLNKQKKSYTFEAQDIYNTRITKLTPFYYGSEMCFPPNPDNPNKSCPPDNLPNQGLPKTVAELYGGCENVPPGVDCNFNPQTAPYVSLTGILPPAGIEMEGIHYSRVFLTMKKTGKSMPNPLIGMMPSLEPNEVPQELWTDFTVVKMVNPNQ